MLATHGMNAGRHLGYYRAGELSFNTENKILQVDARGELHRVVYHDIFRAPLTVPYADFERYFAALRAFYAPHNSALESLLGREITEWRGGGAAP